jgi:carbohydrate-binding DOMON domain-containing protein
VVAVTGDADLVAAAVAVEEPVVAEEAEAAVTADAGAMVQQTAPRIPNTVQAQKPTAGLVVLMSPKSMIAIPIATNYKDIKIQQPELIQREAP